MKDKHIICKQKSERKFKQQISFDYNIQNAIIVTIYVSKRLNGVAFTTLFFFFVILLEFNKAIAKYQRNHHLTQKSDTNNKLTTSCL